MTWPIGSLKIWVRPLALTPGVNRAFCLALFLHHWFHFTRAHLWRRSWIIETLAGGRFAIAIPHLCNGKDTEEFSVWKSSFLVVISCWEFGGGLGGGCLRFKAETAGPHCDLFSVLGRFSFKLCWEGGHEWSRDAHTTSCTSVWLLLPSRFLLPRRRV